VRLIYYIPEGESIDDYKQEWEQVVAEVHTGLSPNIEDFVKDPSVAQLVEIPEYRKAHVPVNAPSTEFVQYIYVDEFIDKDNMPQYSMEIWSKNLDNPSDQQNKLDTHLLQYDNHRKYFYSEHIALKPGWYDIIFYKDKKEMDKKEIAIYEKANEEE